MDLQILYNNPSKEDKKKKSHKGGSMAKKTAKKAKKRSSKKAPKAAAAPRKKKGKSKSPFKKKRNPRLVYVHEPGKREKRFNLFGEEIQVKQKDFLPFVRGKINYMTEAKQNETIGKINKIIDGLESAKTGTGPGNVKIAEKKAQNLIKSFEKKREAFIKKQAKINKDLEAEQKKMLSLGYTKSDKEYSDALRANAEFKEKARDNDKLIAQFDRELDQAMKKLGKVTSSKRKSKKSSSKGKSKKKAKGRSSKRKGKYKHISPRTASVRKSSEGKTGSISSASRLSKLSRSSGKKPTKKSKFVRKNNPSKIEVFENPKKVSKKKSSKKKSSKKKSSKRKGRKAKSKKTVVKAMKAHSKKRGYKKGKYKVKSNPNWRAIMNFKSITKHELGEAASLVAGGAAVKLIDHYVKSAINPFIAPVISKLGPLSPVASSLVDVLLAVAAGSAVSAIPAKGMKEIGKGIIGASVVNLGMQSMITLNKASGGTMKGIIAVPEMNGIIAVPEMNGFGEADFGRFAGDADFGAIIASPEMQGMGEADFGEADFGAFDYQDEGADF